MSTGCFSWCCLVPQWSSKKRRAGPKSDKSPAPVLQSKESTCIENQVNRAKPDKKSSENSNAAAPSTAQYIKATGKQVLSVLKSAAGVIPVPLLQEAIGVALKIIDICEEASAVESKVKDLQDRVSHLMIVIVAHVTSENEDGGKVMVVELAKGMEKDIKGLLGTLLSINEDLTEINAQNRWLIKIYKELNMGTLDDCMNRLSIALEKFKLSNDLRDSDLIQEIHTRLEKMSDNVDDISKDVKHVVTKVDNFDDKLEEFREVFKRSARVLPSEMAVRQEIPLKPEIFHGRDDLVEEISQLLVKEETSRVCILGPGGMGKTSVSLAVVESPLVQEHFRDGNIFWVPCIGATSSALFLETLYVQLSISGDKQVTLGRIISELSTSQDPRLVILDNFETPLNGPGGAQKQVEDTLRRLVQLNHIAILVTMRGSHSPCHHAIKWQSKYIEPTDEKSSLRIFQEINPRSKDDPDLSRILTVLGHMPFAVTLMANLAEEGRSTAKELLDAWSESGPDILSENPEQSMNRSIGLSVDSDLVKRNPNAGLLLATLASLPAGTTKDNLRWWAPTLQTSMIPSAIVTLSKAGLLVENKQQDSNSPVLFVIPVVQSFMQQHERTTDELQRQILSSCCQYVLDHGCRYDDPAFSHKSKALAAEDANIQSILLRPITQFTDSSEKIQEALIAFCWYRCDTVPNLEIINFTVTVAKASRINLHLASALWCLGRTCYQLGEYRRSYDHLQKAYQLFDTFSPGDLKLQRLGGQCGIDLVRVVCISVRDMNEAVSLALNVETKCASLSDDLVHARSLMYVGRALHGAKRPEEALSYLELAKTMLQAVGNAPNLATAYQMISRLHYEAKRLPEALDALKEAWKQTEKSGSPYFQAIISLEYGMMLFSADNDSEAWKYVEIALTKATYVGNRPKIAQSLEYMGYGYLRRGDYRNAYAAYEAAAQKYLALADDWASWLVKNCEDNVSRIKQKQTNPHAVVGFIRPSFDFRESPFYPPGSIPASDLPSINS